MTLVDRWAEEAHNHRWNQSVAQQKDVGEEAFHSYFANHSIVCAKHAWMDHLSGKQEYREFKEPGLFRQQINQEWESRFDPKVVEYVIKRFLGKGYDKHWEFLQFAEHQKEITDDGFDFDTQIFPVLVELGHNCWQVNWKKYFWITDGKLIIVHRD